MLVTALIVSMLILTTTAEGAFLIVRGAGAVAKQAATAGVKAAGSVGVKRLVGSDVRNSASSTAKDGGAKYKKDLEEPDGNSGHTKKSNSTEKMIEDIFDVLPSDEDE